jgi:hypothetical protein
MFCLSEVTMIIVMFHSSNYHCFKAYFIQDRHELILRLQNFISSSTTVANC